MDGGKGTSYTRIRVNRMEMEHWIKRKNELRAKAIMRGRKYSDFILENDIVRPVKSPAPSKEKVAKHKKLSKNKTKRDVKQG